MKKPTREEGNALFHKYLSALKTHRSVTTVAAMHGLTTKQLSRFLNRKGRKARWQKLRTAWKRENNRQRVSASRCRQRVRHLLSRASEILALNRPLDRLDPTQLRVLLEAGVISKEKAMELALLRNQPGSRG